MLQTYLTAAISLAALALAGCQTGNTLTSSATGASAQQATPQPAKAKNVILFIGDGMGVSTVTAMRIFEGQSAGGPGEDHVLPFERFDNVALIKTYNTNQQVPDSAGTATAMHTGVKTKAGVIGVGPDALRGDCAGAQASRLETIGERAVQDGKAVGIVTTTRLTHATPAAVFAHTPERNWEHNAALPPAAAALGCRDIAAQLLAFPFDVAMGGGAVSFVSADDGGSRIGDIDILADWQARTGGTVARTIADMANSPANQPLLGLFSSSHMTYMAERARTASQSNAAGSALQEPTLEDMTVHAINRLKSDKDGYYLMVEGGRIDHAHHDGKAGYAMLEGAAFVKAVQAAIDMTDPQDTMILVTADHSHVFTIAGYATRGNPILGLVEGNDASGQPAGSPSLAGDGKPYTTLGYHNGPGAVPDGPRPQPQTGVEAVQQALIPTGYFSNAELELSETHGGEDVALYGQGPGAQRIKGVMEQNKIYDIISAAYGWSTQKP